MSANRGPLRRTGQAGGAWARVKRIAVITGVLLLVALFFYRPVLGAQDYEAVSLSIRAAMEGELFILRKDASEPADIRKAVDYLNRLRAVPLPYNQFKGESNVTFEFTARGGGAVYVVRVRDNDVEMSGRCYRMSDMQREEIYDLFTALSPEAQVLSGDETITHTFIKRPPEWLEEGAQG